MAGIDSQTEAAFAAASGWSKQILALSTGILTLTISLGETLFGDLSDWQKRWLWISWGLYLLSLVCGVWMLSALTGTMGQTTVPAARDIYDRSNKVPALAQAASFLLATLAIVIFGISAVGNPDKPPDMESSAAHMAPLALDSSTGFVLNFTFDRETRPVAPQRLFSVSDGDTPSILQPVRMVSIDTPEKKHYAGRPAGSGHGACKIPIGPHGGPRCQVTTSKERSS